MCGLLSYCLLYSYLVLSQIYPTDKSGQIRPRIRTYHGRQGRLSETRLKILETLVPKYAIGLSAGKQDLRQVFKSDDVVIDFGCGMGGHAKKLLASGKKVLAVDVHTAGICDLAAYAFENNLDSLRIFHGDGLKLVIDGLTNQSISEFHVYFPDPWPKAKHANRRLFTAEFLEIIYPILIDGGKVYLVTDDDNYAHFAAAEIAKSKLYSETRFDQEITLTSYHRRGLRLGHRIHKFALVKVANQYEPKQVESKDLDHQSSQR